MAQVARWIQDPETGKLIPAEEYQRDDPSAPYVQGDIESFKSPIDGSIISDRAHLRAHNKRHGVTDSRDYSGEYFKSKAAERASILSSDNEKAKRARIDTLNQNFDRFMR